MPQLPCVLEVPDDSGFLGIVDPSAYSTFVAEDWTLDQLFDHFQSEMAKRRMLLWATAMEDIWLVEVTNSAVSSQLPAFRRTSGPIQVTAGKLLLVNYETLTMVAQFTDVSLPEPHLADLLVDVPNGQYACEITQFDDPDDDEREHPRGFLLRLVPDQESEPWNAPAWFQR